MKIRIGRNRHIGQPILRNFVKENQEYNLKRVRRNGEILKRDFGQRRRKK